MAGSWGRAPQQCRSCSGCCATRRRCCERRPRRAGAARAKAGGYGAVVFAASATGRDLAPRVAARLGVPLAQDITDIAVEGGAVTVVHPVYAGRALLKLKLTARPAIVSLRPNVFTAV